jgi:hypothetical protein
MDVTLPDGTIITDVPEGMTQTQLLAKLEANGLDVDKLLTPIDPYQPLQLPEAPKEQAGFLSSFKEEATKPFRLAPELAAYAAKQDKESAEALAKAAESDYASSEFVAPTSLEALGQDWRALKQSLGSSLGAMAAPVGAAIVGGPAAGFGAFTAEYTANNLIRQAQEGLTEEDMSVGKALAAGAGEAVLDIVPFHILGKYVKNVPGVRNLLIGSGDEVASEADNIVKAFKDGTLEVGETTTKYPSTSTLTTRPSFAAEFGKATAGTIAAEVPTEVAQQVLERWQAGLSLDDDDAKHEYIQAAVGAATMAPLFGGVEAGFTTAKETKTVKGEETEKPPTEELKTYTKEELDNIAAQEAKPVTEPTEPKTAPTEPTPAPTTEAKPTVEQIFTDTLTQNKDASRRDISKAVQEVYPDMPRKDIQTSITNIYNTLKSQGKANVVDGKITLTKAPGVKDVNARPTAGETVSATDRGSAEVPVQRGATTRPVFKGATPKRVVPAGQITPTVDEGTTSEQDALAARKAQLAPIVGKLKQAQTTATEAEAKDVEGYYDEQQAAAAKVEQEAQQKLRREQTTAPLKEAKAAADALDAAYEEGTESRKLSAQALNIISNNEDKKSIERELKVVKPDITVPAINRVYDGLLARRLIEPTAKGYAVTGIGKKYIAKIEAVPTDNVDTAALKVIADGGLRKDVTQNLRAINPKISQVEIDNSLERLRNTGLAKLVEGKHVITDEGTKHLFRAAEKSQQARSEAMPWTVPSEEKTSAVESRKERETSTQLASEKSELGALRRRKELTAEEQTRKTELEEKEAKLAAEESARQEAAKKAYLKETKGVVAAEALTEKQREKLVKQREKEEAKAAEKAPEKERELMWFERDERIRRQLAQNEGVITSGPVYERRGTKSEAGVAKDKAQSAVDSTTSGWKNAPKINVVQSAKDLPNQFKDKVSPQTKGFYDPKSGTVHIVGDAHADESDVKATVFHEALGHYGLQKLFGERLDAVLADMYKTNNALRDMANKWIKDNPDTYTSSDKNVRAVEEVLARASEAGPIKAPAIRAAFNRVAALIRKFIRAMGIQLEYSNADISQIINTLSEAHAGVIEGGAEGTASDIAIRYRQAAAPNVNARESANAYQKFLASALDKHGENPLAAATLRAVSNLPNHLYSAWTKASTMYSLVRVYKDIAPRIVDFADRLSMMSRSKFNMLVDFEKKYAGFKKTLAKYPPHIKTKFNDFIGELGLTQAKVFSREEDSNEYTENREVEQFVRSVRANNSYNSLSAEQKELFDVASIYYSLPEDVRKVARDMLSYYRILGDNGFRHTINRILASITDRQSRVNLLERINTNRLEYYTPFRRSGKYKLKFTTPDGEEVVKQFKSEAERYAAKIKFRALGNTNFVESVLAERDLDAKGAPTGLVSEIIKSIRESKKLSEEQLSNMSDAQIEAYNQQTEETVEAVFNGFLEFMPNRIKSEAKGRKITRRDDGTVIHGVRGFEEDALQVFHEYVPNVIYQLNNLNYATDLEEDYNQIEKELMAEAQREDGKVTEKQVRDIMADIAGRIRFAKHPKYAAWVQPFTTANYYWSIAGNISSAIINTTVLPMMVLPSLATKYKSYSKATAAMTTATKMYGAMRRLDRSEGRNIEQFRREIADLANEAGVSVDQLVEFYKFLDDRSSAGVAALQEIRMQEATTDAEKIWGKVNTGLSKVFRETEQFNRGVTHLAAFLMKMDSLSGSEMNAAEKFEASAREAFIFNGEMNSNATPEMGASIFQSNLGRVLGVFRGFTLNMIMQIARAYKNAFAGETPEVKSIARKQLLGIYGAAFLFAGIKGMPGFGAAEWLAALLLGDDDEPFDLQQAILDFFGDIGLNGPLGHFLNVNIADRTGLYGALWRDDPKRLAEVGYIDYAFETALGPTYGLAKNLGRAKDYWAEGNYERALEAGLPSFARNGFKAARFALDGAKTPDGAKLVDDPNAYNILMQVTGLAPQDLALQQSQNAVKYAISDKISNRRTALLANLYVARKAGDTEAIDEAYEAIAKFNKANPSKGTRIDGKTISSSFKQRITREKQTVDGVYLPKSRWAGIEPYIADTEED